MQETDMYDVLCLILKRLEHESIVWRMDGSANVRIQGMDVAVQRLHIRTNDEGLRLFKKFFKQYLKDEGENVLFTIDGIDVEVSNNRYNMLHRIKMAHWRGIDVPILPLQEARDFYAAAGKEKIAASLDAYLHKRFT